LIVLAITAALTMSCGRDGRHADEVGGLLRQGSLASTVSGSDPHFDGGSTVLVEASFDGAVPDVLAGVRTRLEAAGYSVTCPGGRDAMAPSGQDRTSEPRVKCGIGGHGVDGTLWLATTPGRTVNLSAIVAG
jgi:hypothetical protein